MTNLEFIKKQHAICESFLGNCGECPIIPLCCSSRTQSTDTELLAAISYVENYMTNAEKYKQLIKTYFNVDDVDISICPLNVSDCSTDCSACEKWWHLPYEERSAK